MRIAYLADNDLQNIAKKTPGEKKRARCALMLKNQKIDDRIKAELMFAERLKIIKMKLDQLKL